MLDTEFLIVGAGISGLTAAVTLLNKYPGANVTIVDSAGEIGGLLRSVTIDNLQFDFGTHIPQMTSDTALNKMLFPEEVCNSWQRLTKLKTANYFAGEMNNQSQFIDITKKTDLFRTSLYELLQTDTDDEVSRENLDVFARTRFGNSIADNVFAPLMKKFTGHALAALSADAPKYYGLSRLIFGDRNCAANLKKIAAFDNILAYPSDAERPRQAEWIYPPSGKGIGTWIQLLCDIIVRLGGHILLNTKISSVVTLNDFQQIETNQGRINASKVIWTIPVYIGLRGAHQDRPTSNAIAIYHFYSKVKPCSEQHYIYCYEANMQSYRITLYNNIQGDNNEVVYRLSVEVILSSEGVVSSEVIKQELVTMGLFSDIQKITHAGTINLPFGFPVPKAGDEQRRNEIYQQVKMQNPAVLFCGRAKPQVFFMTDVLKDTYDETRALVAQVEGSYEQTRN